MEAQGAQILVQVEMRQEDWVTSALRLAQTEHVTARTSSTEEAAVILPSQTEVA